MIQDFVGKFSKKKKKINWVGQFSELSQFPKKRLKREKLSKITRIALVINQMFHQFLFHWNWNWKNTIESEKKPSTWINFKVFGDFFSFLMIVNSFFEVAKSFFSPLSFLDSLSRSHWLSLYSLRLNLGKNWTFFFS